MLLCALKNQKEQEEAEARWKENSVYYWARCHDERAEEGVFQLEAYK